MPPASRSPPRLSMWLLAWERGDIFLTLKAFCKKSAEYFGLTASSRLDTFLQNWEDCSASPGACPEGQWFSLYGWFIRILGYSDRTDQELERETLRMIDRMFAKYRLIQSGKTEYLILAASRRD